MASGTIENRNPLFAHTGWGTSLEFTMPSNHTQALILYNGTMLFLVWTASTASVNVSRFSTDGVTYKSSTSGTVTFDNITIERSGTTIKFTCGANATVHALF